MMPERRPLGELADALKFIADDGEFISGDPELLHEAAARLREFEGTVIEGFVSSGELPYFKEAKDEARTRHMIVTTYRLLDDDTALILKNPQEPEK